MYDSLASEGCSTDLRVFLLEIYGYAPDSCMYIAIHVLEWFNQVLLCVYIRS